MLRWFLPLLLVTPALIAQQTPEAPEPNSSVATATPLPCGREGSGQLGTAVDVDWWSIVLGAASELQIETSPGAGAQIGDTVVTLLDAGGAPLRTNDNGTGQGYYSRLVVADLAAGTYLVAVERGPFAAGAGSYALDVRCTALAGGGSLPIVAEGPENNDPRSGGTPTTITPDVRCNGTLSTTGPAGDWDFYRFVLTDSSFVRVRVDATPSHPNPPVTDDPILHLYDNGTPPVLIASSSAGSDFGTWEAELALPLAAGTYQVAIRGWLGSVAGRYYLDVRRTVGARAATNAGGCAGRTLDIARTNVGPSAPLAIERPVIGRTYTLQGSGLGANGIVIHAFGVTPALVDLAALGAPGCWLHLAWIDLIAFLADGLGNAAVVLPLGEDPSLLGVPLETQLAVLDFSNALGVTTSNSVSAVIGN